MGTLLTALIRQGDLPGIIQRICAYYVIYDLFKCDGQNETPFLSVFLHAIETKEHPPISKVNLIERNFIAHLLNGGIKEVAKQTPGHVLHQDFAPVQCDITALKLQCFEKHKELPTTVKCGRMNIVPAPKSSPSENSVKDLMEGYTKSDTPLKNVCAPQFMTIAPPLLPVDDEVFSLNL